MPGFRHANVKHSTGKSSKTGFIVGRIGFAKISAIEGIHSKPAMKDRAAEATSKGLSPRNIARRSSAPTAKPELGGV
jgi:hypothetical protein